MSDPFALSVVMPVYAGVDPSHLRRALDSVYWQTNPAQEVLLVEDGPLTDRHYEVLDGFADADPPLIRIRLPENQGAAVANQAGLARARFPWIAKADADDVSVPQRFEKQLEVLRRSELDVLGAAMSEFEGDEANVVGVRWLPTDHEAIVRYMRMNNPINHPTSMYSRALALSVGGYQVLRYMQDYDLFARMMVAGARMGNLAEPLVLFRADPSMFKRRRSRAMFGCEIVLQRRLRSYGVVSRPRALVNLALRFSYRLLPAPAFRTAHRRLFRRRR